MQTIQNPKLAEIVKFWTKAATRVARSDYPFTGKILVSAGDFYYTADNKTAFKLPSCELPDGIYEVRAVDVKRGEIIVEESPHIDFSNIEKVKALFEHSVEKVPLGARTFEQIFYSLIDKARACCPCKALVEYLEKHGRGMRAGFKTYIDIEFEDVRILSTTIIPR